MKRWLTVVVAALPGLALAAAGLVHPAELTTETASTWWHLHIWLVPVFPLLGGVVWLLLRGEHGVLPCVARGAAYVYAVFYTALDTVAGIGAGLAVEVERGRGPVTARLLAVGNGLAAYGVYAYLLAALLVAIVLVRRIGRRALPGALLLVAAAVPFLHAHIYWPVGGLSVLGAGLGAGLLAWARLGAPAEPAA